ncbi:F0F1 ATP synthase subunit B [Thermophilibacter immobilis]|jgi:F-type H+-transporting ATPase subunit b|uniref:ATP synthase subunit b n=1 Tax=Thermophilibacter immobilis TaxID=2779519 RepID=A0A7S7RUT4_9ACTN|nr:F0F1 ATP synthase subunit B [Thermophilibacter immobilis]QOY60767.1 F0F1 ATP synthase subunit B [Thermophilibacter immobilis]
MNSTTRGLLVRAGTAGGIATAGVLATPAFAFADESAVGADILIPKPAEFIPALIAFLIIWFVLAKFVMPQVLQMMEKRQEKIQSDLDSAERSKLEAAEEVKNYEGKIADAHHEAEAIVAKAKKEAEEERSQILAKAQREASDIITKAHGAVGSERHKAMIELSGSVVDLSVEIAGKIIGNDLSEDAQRRLAEKYLAEVGTSDGQ